MIKSPTTRDSLQGRIAALRITTPPAVVRAAIEGASASVVSESSADGPQTVRPARRRRLTAGRRLALGALVLIVALNAITAYFAPTYASALGSVPGVGQFLSWTGLSANDLTTINATTTHDGVTLTVSAGFADPNQTALVVSFVGPSAQPGGGFENMRLTDQFGHSYSMTQAGYGDKHGPETWPLTGYVDFTPLTGAAAAVGARLTLHTSAFDVMGTNPLQTLHDEWDVSFALVETPAAHEAWASATLTGVTYTFTSVTIESGGNVEVQWRAQGPAITAANQANQAAGPSATSAWGALGAYLPSLRDADGATVALGPGFGAPGGGSGGDSFNLNATYQLSPGIYHFVVASPAGSFSRTLTVPA